ncbi:hypothetical protein LINPERHAP2_LOCUS17054, partial [Linum perenne]
MDSEHQRIMDGLFDHKHQLYHLDYLEHRNRKIFEGTKPVLNEIEFHIRSDLKNWTWSRRFVTAASPPSTTRQQGRRHFG